MKGCGIIVSQLNKFVNASYDDTPPETIDNYHLDKQLSNKKVKVYHNETKLVVVNRGTTGTASDWANNVRYGLGTYDETDRLAQAVTTQKAASPSRAAHATSRQWSPPSPSPPFYRRRMWRRRSPQPGR